MEQLRSTPGTGTLGQGMRTFAGSDSLRLSFASYDGTLIYLNDKYRLTMSVIFEQKTGGTLKKLLTTGLSDLMVVSGGD